LGLVEPIKAESHYIGGVVGLVVVRQVVHVVQEEVLGHIRHRSLQPIFHLIHHLVLTQLELNFLIKVIIVLIWLNFYYLIVINVIHHSELLFLVVSVEVVPLHVLSGVILSIWGLVLVPNILLLGLGLIPPEVLRIGYIGTGEVWVHKGFVLLTSIGQLGVP